MSRLVVLITIAIAILSAGFAGCGEAPPGAKPVDAPAKRAEKPGIKQAAPDQIAEPGDPLPPLDKGRLQLSGPKDWVAAPREKKYLAQFITRPGISYPRIMVNAEAADGEADLTAENVAALAKRLKRSLEDDSEKVSASIQSPAPLQIGDRYWVEHVRRAHAKDKPLERLLLVTIAGGRKYTVELRAYVGLAAAHRSEALSVAASMQTAASQSTDDSED